MRELIVGSMCVGGGRFIHDCARACMHACVCVRVCAGSHIDRKMIWFIKYVMMESIKYILSFRISLYLPIYIRTHTHTHTYIHTFMCVCVCGCVWVCVCLDALTLDEENNFIYLRLLHIKR